MKQHKEDLQRVQELERCGEEALKELKKSSLYLYHEAGAPNENIVQNHLNIALLNVF